MIGAGPAIGFAFSIFVAYVFLAFLVGGVLWAVARLTDKELLIGGVALGGGSILGAGILGAAGMEEGQLRLILDIVIGASAATGITFGMRIGRSSRG